MKILQLLIICVSMATFVSCNDTNRNNNDDGNEAEVMDDTMNNRSRMSDDVDDSAIRNTNNEQMNRNDESNMQIPDEKMRKMYRDLNMTQNQVNQFESAYKKEMQNQTDRTAAIDMKKKDDMLKSILKEEQYNDYLQWKKDENY